MKLSELEIVCDVAVVLGEGPAWDEKTKRLYWVDILAGALHTFDPATGLDNSVVLGQYIGCAAPTRQGNVILGLKDGIALLREGSAELDFISKPECVDLPGNRFNDGKCDPFGRFIAGTMDNAEVEASGSLYSYTQAGGIKKLLGGVRISNGLAWSPDYSTMYYIDTPTRQVVAFDYDRQTGDIANRRVVVNVPEGLGWPDGMTSDEAGRLWVGMWGGSAVTVWDPGSGALLEKIQVPAVNVTCCVFGGKERNELYISSARKGVDAAGLRAFPHTGKLFRIKTDVGGMPTFEFDDSPRDARN